MERSNCNADNSGGGDERFCWWARDTGMKKKVSRLEALVQVDRAPLPKIKNTWGETNWGVGRSQVQFWTCQSNWDAHFHVKMLSRLFDMILEERTGLEIGIWVLSASAEWLKPWLRVRSFMKESWIISSFISQVCVECPMYRHHACYDIPPNTDALLLSWSVQAKGEPDSDSHWWMNLYNKWRQVLWQEERGSVRGESTEELGPKSRNSFAIQGLIVDAASRPICPYPASLPEALLLEGPLPPLLPALFLRFPSLAGLCSLRELPTFSYISSFTISPCSKCCQPFQARQARVLPYEHSWSSGTPISLCLMK